MEQWSPLGVPARPTGRAVAVACRGHRIAKGLVQSLFHLDAARSLKQNRIARLRIRADEFTRFFRRIEKERGAVRHPGLHGFVNHEAGSAAYANDGMNTLLSRESANAAVQGLGLAAKLEHFAQHGYAPPGLDSPKNFQH